MDLSENAHQIDRSTLNRRIEQLNISADMKVILSSLLDTTIEVGGRLLNVGARIIAFIFDLAKAYPGVAFGVIAALVLAFLISSIPVIGPILSPFLTPLLLIVGIGLGALNDLTDGAMRQRLAGLESQFKAAGLA